MSSTQSAEPFQEPGLWVSVWRLLHLRVVIQVNGFRRASLRVKISYLAAGLALLMFAGFILFISISFLNLLYSPVLTQYIGDVSPFLENVVTLLVSISAIGILITGFGVLLQALYLSGDMEFLMSAPIPIRAVFIAKLVQAVLPNFAIMCLFTLPVLFGLGISAGYSFLYYPFVVIILVLISLAAAALDSVLVMAAARYFPARRMVEVLGFLIGTAFFIFSQSVRFVRFNVDDQQITSLLKTTDRFNQPWSPLAWAGQGLVALGKRDWLPAGGWLLASLLVTGLIFYVALVMSEYLYHSGWSSLQNNRRKKKIKTTSQKNHVIPVKTQNQSWVSRVIPPPIRAILVKDLLVHRRDLRNISQLLTPLILGVVYAISLLQSGGRGFAGRGAAPAWFMSTLNSLFVYADVALALFLGWMLVANLAGSGFSQEGKQYWMLKAAPVSSWSLLAAKFMFGYLPALLVCTIYILVLEILKGGTLWSFMVSLLAVGMLLAGLTSIFLAFGTIGAKFDWDNPSQMNRAIGCLGSIIGMLFLPIGFALFSLPILLAGLLGLPSAVGQIAGLLFGGAVSAAAVVIPLWLVEKRVAKLNEV